MKAVMDTTIADKGDLILRQYRIAGQGALRFEFQPGERLMVHSVDGEQGCEVIVLNEEGESAPELLVGRVPVASVSIKAQIEEGSTAGKRLEALLRYWHVPDNALQEVVSFTASDLPAMTAQQSMVLILIAAGENMDVARHVLASELCVEHFCVEKAWADVPEPLAVPVKDIRIPNSTATTYEVKAGEWIQIIDVQGKQSSDFIAFDKAAWDNGQEITLDATATRTIMGRRLPQPGLHSRFSDQNLSTMLEVYQDSVGRHDSFLLACNVKYYEDKGYFGHISCTENFNRVLQKYNIKPRHSWPAINFFFNTSSEECGAITSDEPWSQAGDYVLLRASRDLICVSSACPDDIDPANGWNPTDIHIRIYSSEEMFPRSIAYRTTPEEVSRMTKHTGFHSRTSALTQHFSEYRGYWVATQYEGWGPRAEYLACRERVAMLDLTPLRKFEIIGPDAEAFMQLAITRNVRRVSIGEIVYSAICHETGGMIDDGTLFRMSEEAFRWICGDPYTGIWLRDLAVKHNYRVSVRDSTDQLHNLAVQGPDSRALLASIIWTPEWQPDMEKLRWFHFTIGRIGGPDGIPVMVSRTGYTGELGFEVWCHPDTAVAVWDAIWEAGQPYDIAPLGFDALDMLRIEAGLIFADHEFCPETNPYEAGIGFTVPMKTKEENFIGRDAMARQSMESRHKLVGLFMDSADPVAHGDQVFNGRFPVGVITSAIVSPVMKKTIAMCRVAPDFAAPGTRLEVGQLDGHKKRLGAEVTSLPFYDPERTRVRS
jgi:aminomethyltransferase